MSYELRINNINYIQYLKSQSLSINIDLDDYSIRFSLIIPKSSMSNIEAGADVIVKQDGKIVCAGIVYNIDYTYISDKFMQLDITTDNYTHLTGRILATPLNDFVQSADLNKAESLFLAYYNKYLKQYNITLAEIKTNLTIDEISLDTTEKTLKEILDNLAELTKSEYYVDYDKTFTVYKGKRNAVQHDTPMGKLRNIKVSKTLENYRNRYLLVGGTPATGTTVDPSYLNSEGKLYCEVTNTDEINRIKRLIGGDGLFTVKEENDKLSNLAEMQNYANIVINKYGKPPITIEFDLFNATGYKVGDFIKVYLPEFNLNDYFCIDSISISEEFGADLLFNYHFQCSLRLDNLSKENLWNVLGGNKITPVVTNPADNGGSTPGVLVDSVDIQIQNAIMTTSIITFQ